MLSPRKPAVSRYWLFAIAGVLWSAVGILLCRLAYTWLAVLAAIHSSEALFLGLLGLLSALVVYRLGFSKIALKNIARLSLLSDEVCIFAFQAWKSYLIIGAMIALGVILRHSAIPKHYLAVIYLAIGFALFLSGLHYYTHLWQVEVRGQSGTRP